MFNPAIRDNDSLCICTRMVKIFFVHLMKPVGEEMFLICIGFQRSHLARNKIFADTS